MYLHLFITKNKRRTKGVGIKKMSLQQVDTWYTPYEGPDPVKQKDRKLVAFEQRLEKNIQYRLYLIWKMFQ